MQKIIGKRLFTMLRGAANVCSMKLGRAEYTFTLP